MVERLAYHDRLESLKRPVTALSIALGAFAVSACGTTEEPAPRSPAPAPVPSSSPSPVRTTAEVGMLKHLGYDVSFPQCGKPLPARGTFAFAIVGVNGTLPTQFNPCFKELVKWSQGATGATRMRRMSVYVTAANPVDENVPTWPKKSGRTPYGYCAGGKDQACAYQYGEDRARADLGNMKAYLRAVPEKQRQAYIDVERDYSWGRGAHKSLNAVVLEAMMRTLQKGGVPRIGFYSNAATWQELVGPVPPSNPMYSVPMWMMGAGTLQQAVRLCESAERFTKGPIDAVQVPGEWRIIKLDTNVSCAG